LLHRVPLFSQKDKQMEITTQKNKDVVRRFNQEVIVEGNGLNFNELVDNNFINRTAPQGMDNGPKGMQYFFNQILRPAFTGLSVTIHQQVAEGDLVTTRKTINGIHTGVFMGIAPTGQVISIEVIDMVRVQNGKYVEHWGITSLSDVLAELKSFRSEEKV